MRITLSKAQRLHDRARLKAKRRYHWGFDHAQPEWADRLSALVDTPTPCSCYSCGNPRKYFGEPTMQERRESQRGAHPDPWQSYRNGNET
jgi:hypothetical protein